MLAVLTSAQWTELVAFAEVEPFGEPTAWLRSAILTSLIANVHRRKGAPAFKPQDFMPEPPEKRMRRQAKQTPEEMKAILAPLLDSLRSKGRVRKRGPRGG